MLLVIDVGNTNTVIGVYKNDVLKQDWRIRTVRENTADEFNIHIGQGPVCRQGHQIICHY